MAEGPNELPPFVGIPWYSRADYPRIRRLMVDGNELPRTYDEWLAQTEVACQRYQRRGVRVVPADVKAKYFAAWCRAEGLKLDADSCMAFARILAAQDLAAEQTARTGLIPE